MCTQTLKSTMYTLMLGSALIVYIDGREYIVYTDGREHIVCTEGTEYIDCVHWWSGVHLVSTDGREYNHIVHCSLMIGCMYTDLLILLRYVSIYTSLGTFIRSWWLGEHWNCALLIVCTVTLYTDRVHYQCTLSVECTQML